MSVIQEMGVVPFSKLCTAGFKGKIIDVRTPAEFAEIRAELPLVNIPLDTMGDDALSEKGLGDKNGSLYLICRSGARSMKACEILTSLGYKNLTNITGGTMAWSQQGLPVTRG